MIIGHRTGNSRSYDEVMIKLPYDKLVTLYDHYNIFLKIRSLMLFLFAYLNVHYLTFLPMVHEYAYIL